MTTARTIITAALQELGVIGAGDTPDGADLNDCLKALNILADAMLTEPNYADAVTMVSAALPAATTTRTIGPSMQFNTARPIRLEQPGCYVTVSGVDYPLEVIDRAEYNAIQLKSTVSAWPIVCHYDSKSPTGTVYFWPVGACTVNLMVLEQVSQFATLTTSVTLQPGYERLFKFSLMEEMAGVYGRQLSPLQMRNAAQARRLVKRANFRVPQLNTGGRRLVGIPEIY